MDEKFAHLKINQFFLIDKMCYYKIIGTRI